MALSLSCPQKFHADKTFRHILWATTLYNAVINGCAPECCKQPNVQRYVHRLECAEDPECVMIDEIERLLCNVLDGCHAEMEVWGVPGECAPGPIIIRGGVRCVAKMIARVARVICTFREPCKTNFRVGEPNCGVSLFYRLQGCARKMPDPCDWLASVCFGTSGTICGSLGTFATCVDAFGKIKCEDGDCAGCDNCSSYDDSTSDSDSSNGEFHPHAHAKPSSGYHEADSGTSSHGSCKSQGKELNGCCEIPSTPFDIPISIMLDCVARRSRKFTRLIVFADMHLFEKQTCIPLNDRCPMWSDDYPLVRPSRQGAHEHQEDARHGAPCDDGHSEGTEPAWFEDDFTE